LVSTDTDARTGAGRAPASTPPHGLAGLQPEWSRVVDVVDADGVIRGFHVLDSHATADAAPAVAGTLLCVHGNPTWSYLWRALVAAPPTGWRAIAVDQLGMGFSERIGEVRRLAQRIDDLGRLTEALGVTGPVVTVAHDWGGPVSLGWALAHRDQLVGVVLANTAVHQPAGSPAPALIRLARTPALLRIVCEQTPTFVRATTAVSRPRPAAEIRDAFAAPYATADRRRAVADFVADIPLEDDHPSMPTLAQIASGMSDLDVPVLLAWGPADPVFSDLYLRDLITRLPHADVHRYERASHLVTEDAPSFFPDVRTWIEQLGRTRAAAPPPATAPVDPDRRWMGAALAERGLDPETGDEVAVAELGATGRRITWRRLARVVDDLAAGLIDAGVRPGDRVALLVPPGADLTAAVYACWRIGAVIVVADSGLGPRGLARALRGAWPEHLIAIDRGLVAARALRIGGRRFAAGPMSAGRARLLGAEATLATLAERGRGQALPPLPRPDDEAAVLFTSGATGPAKGVVYRHRQIEANRDALAALYDITSADRLVAAFAPFALYGPALGIASAVPDIDVTKPAELDASRLADAVRAVGATLVWASPASLQNVVDTAGSLGAHGAADLATVRLLMSAGAPVPARLLREVLALMPSARAHTPYGMTEVLPVADIDLAGLDAAGSGEGVCVGHPVPGAVVMISALDAAGSATGDRSPAPGVTGEILVSAPWAKDRYDRLWATQARSARDAGWHRTGDVGHLDDAGRLWVEGRLAHVVTTADGPVTPVGVEQRVLDLPGIRSAACVGIGPAGGQVIAVVVVPDPQPTRREALADPALAAQVRAAAGVPVAAVLVRRGLPVDVRHNSKIDRAALSAWATERLS
jgi:acyl-coenzyme A synthetase/AMP-(fatty) acid ligase/pimeloyl-ACP methyl ester carboxylesterase